jgi:hypothetical protein
MESLVFVALFTTSSPMAPLTRTTALFFVFMVMKSLWSTSGEWTLSPLLLTFPPHPRAGYTPDDYPTESEWLGRELIESSAAVKCPNISYHLAGTKKVQQVLANPNELEKFMSSEDCAQLRQVCPTLPLYPFPFLPHPPPLLVRSLLGSTLWIRMIRVKRESRVSKR